NAQRIERVLHPSEARETVLAPHGGRERCSQSAVAMLARERSAERCGERDGGVENPHGALAPVGMSRIDERIHVHVRVARMTKDHTARVVRGENLTNAANVRWKILRRHRGVLDEL